MNQYWITPSGVNAEYVESHDAFWCNIHKRFYQLDIYKDLSYMYAVYDNHKYFRIRKRTLLKNFNELSKIESIARQTLWNYIFRGA